MARCGEAKGEDHIHDDVLRPLRVHVPLPIQEARPCPFGSIDHFGFLILH